MRLCNSVPVTTRFFHHHISQTNFHRTFLSTLPTMGVTKTTISEGNGPSPVKGQTVTMEYTGWVKDASKPDNKGAQ